MEVGDGEANCSDVHVQYGEQRIRSMMTRELLKLGLENSSGGFSILLSLWVPILRRYIK